MSGHADREAIRIDATAVRRFGDETAGLAGRLHDAAERTRRGDPGTLSVVLGPIGVPVLTALTAAHNAHVHDLDRLGHLLAGMGDAAIASATAYEQAVTETGTRLGSAAEDL